MSVQFKITNDQVTMQEALKINKEADLLVNVLLWDQGRLTIEKQIKIVS